MPVKKPEIKLQDIYQKAHSAPQDETPQTVRETIAEDIRRHQVVSFFFGILLLGLTLVLVAFIIRTVLPHRALEAPAVLQISYTPAYTLPADEQWVLAYRQTPEYRKDDEGGGAKPFSRKWVHRTAYECILGEQAFRMKDWETAQRHFEKALETFPDLRGVHRALGATCLNRQDFKAAAKQLELALKEDPSVDVLNNLGAAYIGTGQYAEAERVLKEALTQNPELPGSYKNLALLYRGTGRTNDACCAFETFLTLSPKETSWLETLIQYEIQTGQSARAIGFLERIQGADPKAVPILLAKAAASNGDVARAVRALRDASRFLSPRQMVIAMHDDVFEGIAREDSFAALLHEMELASISPAPGQLSTGTD